MFEQPKTGQFTQGTVFSCAYAENYLNEKVYGLVITARCDAAQEKVPVYTYIPVVPLTTWMLRDGAIIAFDRALADIQNTLTLLLTKAELSPSLLRTHSLDEIFTSHFLPLKDDKAKNSQFVKFDNNLKFHKKLIDWQSQIGDAEAVKLGLQGCAKVVEGIVKELAGNRLSGHYLLRGVQTWEAEGDTDFVVLLREVHHIPSKIARKIVDGMAPCDWAEIRKSDSTSNSVCPKFIGEDDFSLPIGKITSPWIEHIMQCFSMLFARIGVKDIDHEDVKKSLTKIGLGA